MPLDTDLPDPVHVPSFIFVMRDIIFISASIDAGGAIRRTLGDIDHHTPLPATGLTINFRPSGAAFSQYSEGVCAGNS